MTSQDKLFRIDENGYLPQVTQIESPNYDLRAPKQTISLIVIHCISLPPNKFGNSYIEDFFKNELDIGQHAYFKKIKDLKVSSHFLIKRKGELIQFVPCLKRAWHAGESVWRNKKIVTIFQLE